ncbi:recombinase family protein [Streptococcus cristatus]|uniref:recombinase family protein n=1 Tax=Streptococcus cristatus TaxID=45634 RepID=UPI000F66AE04|nr:recombinase family protein [Streptococcus cristatus]RSJ74530.1 putative transposon Tn552 DNA-invertase bin3 [Streptococcus cristatus]
MKIGYIRASTKDQNLARQIEMMKQEGVNKVFSEKVSGKDMNRKELKALLKFAREGDEIIVSSLDRLGRDYQDIKEIVRQLQQRCIKLTIIDAPFLNFNTGNNTLDTAMFDMFLSLLGYIAQNEREKILERQRQGIKLAKQRGVYKGRPIQYHEHAKNAKDRLIYHNVKRMLEEHLPVAQIAKENGISRQTVYIIRKRLE